MENFIRTPGTLNMQTKQKEIAIEFTKWFSYQWSFVEMILFTLDIYTSFISMVSGWM